MKRNGLLVLIVILIVAGAWYLFAVKTANEEGERVHIDTVMYVCEEGHTISASYFEGQHVPDVEPGERPEPTGSVDISIDGGATTTLSQTISASGIRYANRDESLVFWSKGNEALIMRDNGMDLDYQNCVAEE